MSHWNNSYTHNNQYQDPNMWNGERNEQYAEQNPACYSTNNQYNPGNEYVSFNEFLSQIQSDMPSQSTSNNYNGVHYQNLNVNQHNAQSSSQSNDQSDSFNTKSTRTAPLPSRLEKYQSSVQNQFNTDQVPSSYQREVALKSNLTPTATEFVPKSSTSKFYNDKRNRNVESAISDEAYSSGAQNGSSLSNSKVPYKDQIRNGKSNNKSYGHNNQEPSVSSENSYYSQDSSRHGYGSRNQDRHSDFNGRQESSTKGNSKLNYVSRNKDSYSGSTFYNSSMNKNSQDVRNGRGESSGGRNRWAGSQRVKPERNNIDDEQFANHYLQYQDEKTERLSKVQGNSSPMRSKSKYVNSDLAANTELTQRERLSEQLDKGTLECLVCCERVKQTDQVWWCSNCYHVMHLRCIRKWAISSMIEGKWRCPACQNTNSAVPTEYRCLCGAVRNPEHSRGSSGAHTCGRACRRPRTCPHPCTLLCHPGPCPPCQATVNKKCGCGAETRSVLCSSKLPQICGGQCHKKLNCLVHECQKDCHEGPCNECTEMVEQECYCPATRTRSVPCTSETSLNYQFSCSDVCGRVLACGSHVCRDTCHEPPCKHCHLHPDVVTTCPCGNTKIEKGTRKACTDPIPLCGKICAKPLTCGPVGDKHFCKQECHEGACPVCPDKTVLQCRCGHSSREVKCEELQEMIDNIFCQKKCNKKLSCGRHRCREVCCAVQLHRCGVVCGRSLSCQLHRCEELCHTGHCPPCPRLSFSELRCRCGSEVILPPVRCGTRRPTCAAPCVTRRECGHAPHHVCHDGDCPPCVVLTSKRCHGDHEERKTIPCSQEEFSCGLPCGKPLLCGKHTCIKICHKGSCDTTKCSQPCLEKRPSCGHPCNAPCHVDNPSPCPSSSPCKKMVLATCLCGRRQQQKTCSENMQQHNKMLNALAATKMQEGGSFDLSELSRPGSNLKTLDCDDECRVERRTRQMALALQIRNPDVAAKLAPRYSEHVRAWAAKDPAFAQSVHNQLTELVHRAKKSKQKTRSHSFPSMNWQKRQFIHELCEHFGCESVAYDAEPNRNVVATADKEKSWLPAMSVMEVLAREAGKRRVPGPVLRNANSVQVSTSATSTNAMNSSNKSTGGWATLTSTNAWAARSQPKLPETKPEPKIDYFDNPPE